MTDPTTERIKADPRFRAIADRRNRLAWTLFGITMALYFSLILTATFNPAALSVPLYPGAAVTVGWPIGAATIIIPWLLTIYYVRQANSESQALSTIVSEAMA
ncbi:DUF485 domain-containing protein [Amaricoccus sp. HAR-UPW-R2A-40]|nr:DUF485 domain-containing protein [Amaricoccus sp. HAR-UPW-R2A-40]